MIVARASVLGLAFLLSGVACLIACASTCVAEPAHTVRACCARSAAIDAEEGCPASPAESKASGTPSLDGCCFFAARSDVAAASHGGASTAMFDAVSQRATFDFDARETPSARALERVRDRGDTHLRCCVFLI